MDTAKPNRIAIPNDTIDNPNTFSVKDFTSKNAIGEISIIAIAKSITG
ncbi:MAG: hypothetical protein ACJAYA_001412 [Bacteroidia bacterium]